MSEPVQKKSIPLYVGVSFVAGGAVGAGMFSLPIASSGMWFGWAAALLLFSWFCLCSSALMLLETNLNFKAGESFDTFVRDTIGNKWNIINGVTMAFTLYTVTYAYVSGGGSIVNQTLESGLGITLPPIVAGLGFALVLSFFVWYSTGLAGRITSVLVISMIITFFISVGTLAPIIELPVLLDFEFGYGVYLWAAVPYFMASYAFHSAVPSLVKYYGVDDVASSKKSIIYGSLIAFVVYLLWILVTQGNIARMDFIPIIENGGNVGDLIATLSSTANSPTITVLVNAFANFAVVSSFFGVTIGLFDYIADKFKFGNDRMGRFKTALITFIPPTIGGVFFPNGFLYAIGLVGLFATVMATFIPALCVRASRKKYGSKRFLAWGGDKLVYLVLAYGIAVIICYFLSAFGWLPKFG